MGEGEVWDMTIEADVELDEAIIEEGESSDVMIEVDGEVVVMIEEGVEVGGLIGEGEVLVVMTEEADFRLETTMEAEAEDTTSVVDEMMIEEREVAVDKCQGAGEVPRVMMRWTSMTRIKLDVAVDEVVGLGEYLVIVAAVTMMKVWTRRRTSLQLVEVEIAREAVSTAEGAATRMNGTSMEEEELDSNAVVVGMEGEGV